MIILSCFDGMSCGQIAFERVGIKVDKYYASEIDKYAMKVTQENYPDTIQLGSIENWKDWNIETPDIIIGGSPCQGFSFAGKGLNFNDPRSRLFFTFVDIIKHYKPKYFLLENVRMKAEHESIITQYMGISPVMINSSLVSAQNRERLYWTNIGAHEKDLFGNLQPGIKQPEDKEILLKDIIESGQAFINQNGEHKNIDNKSTCIDANYWKGIDNQGIDNHRQRTCIRIGSIKDGGYKMSNAIYSVEGKSPTLIAIKGGNKEPKIGAFRGRYIDNPTSLKIGLETEQRLELREDYKSNTLTTVQKDNVIVFPEATKKGYIEAKPVDGVDRTYPNSKTNEYGIIQPDLTWRKLTPLECERLQTVPEGYTAHVSNSQRYKLLGNGWTCDVIVHILKHMEAKK